jgi:uncharacterized RDD family membrane protein YckC
MKESTSIAEVCDTGTGVSSVSAQQGYERVVTPEAVPLELDVAGLGSRGIAIAIDMTIQFCIFLAITFFLAAVHPGDTVSLVIITVSVPVVFWGYFFFFEGIWHGRTPGKRTQRLRATRADGQPMSGGQMAVRNLVRIVDFLPLWYAVGCVTMVLTKRSQRLGDLAGGTLVIREPKPFVPKALDIPPPPPVEVSGGVRVDVTGMTEAHYQLLRSYFERRSELGAAARAQLARQIAVAITPVVRTAQPMMDEQLLEEAARAYRGRLGG